MDSVKLVRLDEVLPDFRKKEPQLSVEERLQAIEAWKTQTEIALRRMKEDHHSLKYGKDSE